MAIILRVDRLARRPGSSKQQSGGFIESRQTGGLRGGLSRRRAVLQRARAS